MKYLCVFKRHKYAPRCFIIKDLSFTPSLLDSACETLSFNGFNFYFFFGFRVFSRARKKGRNGDFFSVFVSGKILGELNTFSSLARRNLQIIASLSSSLRSIDSRPYFTARLMASFDSDIFIQSGIFFALMLSMIFLTNEVGRVIINTLFICLRVRRFFAPLEKFLEWKCDGFLLLLLFF